MTSIRTVIADEQVLFLEGLKLLLEQLEKPTIEVVGSISLGEDLKEIDRENNIELVFMNINFLGINCFEIIESLKRKHDNILVCIMTSYRDSKFVKRAFQNGADGYFLKTDSISKLNECLITMINGERYMSDGLAITPRREIETVKEDNAFKDNFLLKQKLTKRENEVLRLIADAKSNKEIAKELFISDQTVGVHRKNIMRKLGVKNTVTLIKFAFENGLIR